jgi:hypothetical protein
LYATILAKFLTFFRSFKDLLNHAKNIDRKRPLLPLNIYAKKWLTLSWETILLHTTNLIYGANECLCKKMVDAFMGNYPVTYNQPDKFSLDRETREVQR